jgi:hypothetical protein
MMELFGFESKSLASLTNILSIGNKVFCICYEDPKFLDLINNKGMYNSSYFDKSFIGFVKFVNFDLLKI